MKKKILKDNEFNVEYWIQYGIDIEKRRVMIDEDIDEYCVGWAIRGIQLMEDASQKPIDVYISSYGGSVYDGLALYDTLASSKCLIRTYAIGKAMSMGFIIYLAGDERRAMKYATFMNHSMSGAAWGKVHELETEYKECQRLEDIACEILASSTNKSKAWWHKKGKYEDDYINVDEAAKLGIITHK